MRLNNKTIRNYLLYSSVIFLLTIPVLYLVMRSVLLHSVDRSLKTQLKEIRDNLSEIHSQEEIVAWSRLDKDISLEPGGDFHKDEIYTVDRYNTRHKEKEPFREIAGNIQVEGRTYELIIRSSLIENEELLGSILLVQVSVLIILVGGLIWINHRLSKRLWQPFYVALKNMQTFELNKQTSLSFKDSTTDEFNELNSSIKALLDRNSAMFLQQKEFTENASHEMQTPLAIVQSKLELLMQTSPLSEEQAALINALDDTNRRIVRLNKTLLLLSKIENNQYESIDVVETGLLCQRLIRQYQIYAEAKEIKIKEQYSAGAVVCANTTLIEILVSNLLTNAIRYNRDNGEILVTADSKGLIVQNTGVSYPLNAERIFDRFHKETRLAGNDDGTGLGLAIVKNICNLYHYTVSYNFADGWHVFKVSFTAG